MIGLSGVAYAGILSLRVRVAAKELTGEITPRDEDDLLAEEYTPPTPGVFCGSMSKERCCGNECAQVCETKGEEKWIARRLRALGEFWREYSRMNRQYLSKNITINITCQ